MGHRKHSAPRRGSLAYRPRGRANRVVPRIRNWPAVDSDKPTLLGFPAFKAGTLHAITIDDRERTPNSGKPLFNASTVLALPQTEVKGVRLYGRENGAEKTLTEAWTLEKAQATKVPIERVTRVAAMVSVTPSEEGLSQKTPLEFEMGVGGGDPKAQVEYVSGLIGKKVRFQDVFKSGLYVDVLGITKGQGVEGPITRFGVKRKQHKSRKTVREVGVIGPWHPAAVMYTIARAGQMGFHQRTETGKRIISVGNEKESPITPPGGFMHFGILRGDYVILRGSVPGPARRFAVVRFPVRRKKFKLNPPQLIEVSTRTRA